MHHLDKHVVCTLPCAYASTADPNAARLDFVNRFPGAASRASDLITLLGRSGSVDRCSASIFRASFLALRRLGSVFFRRDF